MKIKNITLFAFFLVLGFAVSSCKSSSDNTDNASTTTTTNTTADPSYEVVKAPDGSGLNTTTTNSAKPAEPAQNAAGVWHYTCPNGCEGGGGASGPCAKCGATLAHNAAYHSGGNAAPSQPIQVNSGQPPLGSNAAAAQGLTNAQPNRPAEPAQNAAGVWHFTCPKGCSGGGGAVGPCASCGATLAHNTAYHQ